MTLHNYIRKHDEHDHHFENIRDNPEYCTNQLMVNIQNENKMTSTSNAQEIDNLRDLTAASLMRKEHN